MKHHQIAIVFATIICMSCPTSRPALAQAIEPEPLPDLTVIVTDESGDPVRGVMVGTTRRESEYGDGVLDQGVPASLVKWGGNGLRCVPLITDKLGRVSLHGVDLFPIPWYQSRAIYAQDPAGGRAALKRVTREDLGTELTLKLEPACLILADFQCTALADRGIPLIETTSYLNWEGIQLVLTHSSDENRCSLIVPPGEYTLRLKGYGQGVAVPGQGGAPTNEIQKNVIIKPGQRRLDLGTIDLEPSAQGLMVGEPAPPLGEIALWKNTEPFTLEDQRGKVVVLLFWSRGCSTQNSVAWLGGIYEHLKDRGLEVLAIHEADAEISDSSGFDEIAQPLIDQAAAEKVGGIYPERTSGNLPIAVACGNGLGDAFMAYHVTTLTGVLIDREGKVRHIFEHGINYKVIERALERDN